MPGWGSGVAAVRDQLVEHGAEPGIDIVCSGMSMLLGEPERSQRLARLAAAGMTWWLDWFEPGRPAADIEEVVRRGPPTGGP